MGGLDACSGWALAKRAGPPTGRAWGGLSFAASRSETGDTAEWQTTQAAQGAPWLWSQEDEAGDAESLAAAQRSASVSVACRLALPGSAVLALWWWAGVGGAAASPAW